MAMALSSGTISFLVISSFSKVLQWATKLRMAGKETNQCGKLFG